MLSQCPDDSEIGIVTVGALRSSAEDDEWFGDWNCILMRGVHKGCHFTNARLELIESQPMK